jgi:hypothetical protein
MLRFHSLTVVLSLVFSFQIFADKDRYGEHAGLVELQIGFLGETNANEVSIGGASGTALMGVENGIGFKVQGGYKFHLHKQFSVAGFLGHLNHKTVARDGYTLETSAFDMSFALQFHPTGRFFFRGGVNYPFVSTFTRTMDNKTDENINGGNFEGLGKIGYDILVGYDVYEKLHIFLGFSKVRLSAKKKFTGYSHPTAGTSYEIKYDDIGIHQFIAGLNYTF